MSGHASARDLVLVLDVARFNYPPHWVSLPMLWEAMLPLDLKTTTVDGACGVQGTCNAAAERRGRADPDRRPAGRHLVRGL